MPALQPIDDDDGSFSVMSLPGWRMDAMPVRNILGQYCAILHHQGVSLCRALLARRPGLFGSSCQDSGQGVQPWQWDGGQPVVAGCRFARHHWVCMLLFCFLVSGRLWGWCLESFWGVSVPLPPCSRARRSPSTPLGARGLVVAAHRVVMVTLRARLRCSRPHHLSRHLPQAHLLLMSLNVVKCNLS